MKKRLIAGAVSAGISLYGLSVSATDLYVSSTGTNNSTCAVNSPCANIVYALNQIALAGAGQYTIKIAKGIYEEAVTFSPNASGFDVSFQGGWNAGFTGQECSADNTVMSIASTGNPMTFYVAAGYSATASVECLRFTSTTNNSNTGIRAVVDGGGASLQLSLSKSRLDSFDYHGIYFIAQNDGQLTASITDSEISENVHVNNHGQGASGMRVDAIRSGSIDLTLIRNIIKNNISLSGGGGLEFQTSSAGTIDAEFINNLIAGNEGAPGGAISATNSMDAGSTGRIDLALTNDTLSGNSSTGIGGGFYLSSPSNTISALLRNTIVWGNNAVNDGDDIAMEIHPWPGDSSGFNVAYSIVGDIYYIPNNGQYVDKGHNLDEDPILDGNYMLSSSSPARNAGICGYSLSFMGGTYYSRVAPYDDIEGESRPGLNAFTGCDIGADEYTKMLCFPVKNKSNVITQICM